MEITKKKIRPMSQIQYVRNLGSICPFCRSEDIEAKWIGFEVSDNGVTQTFSCNNCDSTWYDQYKLTGYVAT